MEKAKMKALLEALEVILEDNGIPIVPALSFDGKKMIEVDGHFFYVFKWQEGHITDQSNISKEQCYKAGEIIGKIHAIDSHNCEEREPELSCIDFRRYLKKAKDVGSNIVAVLDNKHGEAEVINTIGRISYLLSLENDICDVLDKLTTPDA